MNELKEGQIYTLNNGETYDIIHESSPRNYFEDKNAMCYEIVVMKDLIDSRTGKIFMCGDGTTVEWENCSLEIIRKNGVLVGELGKTHHWVKHENGCLVLKEKK